MILLPLFCLLCPGFGPASAQEIRPGVVTVSEGAHALLPCALGPGQDKFDWRKDHGVEKKEVFMYKRGSYYGHGLDGQSEQFRGRVLFFKDELRSGNASIKIQNTRLEDNGTYTCVLFKPNTNEVEKEITIRLNVGAVPRPSVQPIRIENTWWLLQCQVQGHPKPEVEWRDSAGKPLLLSTEDKHVTWSEDLSGRFFVELELNVTRSDEYTCVATQREIHHQINNTLLVRIQDIVDAVAVSEGEDAILPCSLESRENIHRFSWSKDHKEVFFYDTDRVKSEEQRLTHFEHKLKSGNASIKIHNTQKSDSGRYSCKIPDIQTSYVILNIVEKMKHNDAGTGSTSTILGVLLGFALFCLVAIVSFFCWYYVAYLKKPSNEQPKQSHIDDSSSFEPFSPQSSS
ncbi:butyrophilin-like protein 2 isoform X2 [Periophthalmus magnuspinnatus]|uniref:butyrophilin-like protein 2 isoform X2 n=1 Tax=Periophthalmus magnuspinnatus TaxID=409849 RepID=UPI0024373050|nr:butyrophilin-like protein 2 isoform X2 [Periophthalmus magnuspinnatus]